MATIIGKVDSFEDGDDWDSYLDRLVMFFQANDVPSEKHVPALLSLIGSRCYALLKGLTAPDNPSSKSFKELTDLLAAHFTPKPLVIAERFRFYRRSQKEGESILQYMAELRKLSQHCDFGAFLPDALRDKLVCGLFQAHIQRKLLSEDGLTVDRAMSIAVAMETAAKDALELRESVPTPSEQPVNQVSAGSAAKPVTRVCYRCTGRHDPSTCRFKDEVCFGCSKRGHTRKVCRSVNTTQFTTRSFKPRRVVNPQNTHRLEPEVDEYSGSEGNVYHLKTVTQHQGQPYTVEVKINGVPISLEIDTGAAVTVLNQSTYERTRRNKQSQLQQTTAKLKTYTGQLIPVMGIFSVEVTYDRQVVTLSALVVSGRNPCLLGRDWLRVLKLNWKDIFQLQQVEYSEVDRVLEEFSDVFKEELGTMKDFKAKIFVDSTALPIFCKARPLPYALKKNVEAELDRLVHEGTICPVTHSDWAAPIVPVVKADGTIRICRDYKSTVNKVSKLDRYPIPKTEDLLTSLCGGKTFSKLDLSQAYQQLPLDEESRKYLTINTHKGLFEYCRLPFGVKSAPGIFQRALENLLRGLPHVIVRMDDILLTGLSDAEHLQNLREVLGRLSKAGLRLKRSKCSFFAPEVVYCGRVVTAAGTRPAASNVQAILEARAPQNSTELRAFLGMLNFYHADLPHLATTLEPLHQLLRKHISWRWDGAAQAAFEKAKTLLTDSKILTHYDEHKPLLMACDSSPYGVGAVLSHIMADGSERPIAFAS